MTTLQNALRELAQARRQHEIANEYADEHRERVEAMTAYQEMIEAKKRANVLRSAIGDAEDVVRELALAEHAASGNYKPAHGVQIKEFSKVMYAPNLALDWCIAHAPKYLALHAKAFEKAASVLRDLGAPVELTKEARAQIATDLSAWLLSEQQLFPVIEDEKEG